MVSGCGPGEIRLNREVASSEIIGIWPLDQSCLNWLAKESYTNIPYKPESGTVHEIEFRADGTCRFRSIIEQFERNSNNSAEYIDSEGTWKLRRPLSGTRKCNENDLTINKNGGKYGISLDFTELFEKLELWHYWGDPDGCNIMHYGKAINK